MSLLQLKNPNASQFPHNGWPFEDQRTKFKCAPHEGNPEMQALKIIKNRQGNPHIYPTSEPQWFDKASVIQEVYAFKAKTHAHLFRGYPDKGPPVVTPAEPKSVQLSPTTFCTCGSNEFTPIYCKTCGGKKITGYKCSKCGKEKS